MHKKFSPNFSNYETFSFDMFSGNSQYYGVNSDINEYMTAALMLYVTILRDRTTADAEINIQEMDGIADIVHFNILKTKIYPNFPQEINAYIFP